MAAAAVASHRSLPVAEPEAAFHRTPSRLEPKASLWRRYSAKALPGGKASPRLKGTTQRGREREVKAAATSLLFPVLCSMSSPSFSPLALVSVLFFSPLFQIQSELGEELSSVPDPVRVRGGAPDWEEGAQREGHWIQAKSGEKEPHTERRTSMRQKQTKETSEEGGGGAVL
ncbi:hypothetical protein E2562_009054 [Oryza meyeriana var. granulata]|uniref:Uncharacterized protein n=1 Tax=Oryza meyeriana var. granulata TaxID=110450 RepID=A0A6G1D0X6_9ORYZ|nr:hypothetical protein E2562_009054 [Oryza meyeriana var. granulata]